MKLSQSWRNLIELSTTQNDARQRVLYPLKIGEIRFGHSREKSVAVIEAGSNHTASDDLGNFIRQWLPDMPRCPDVMIARSAGIFHMLVEWQLPVEGDAKASNARRRLNDSIWHNYGNDFLNFVTSTSGCELNHLGFDWVELQTIHQ